MPLLKIEVNIAVDASRRQAFLAKASSTVARLLGKPESYVVTVMAPDASLLFGGSDAPAAYLELKSIGLPESETAALSSALCDLMTEELGIGKDRTYIEFANAERHMWGYNGATF